MTTVSGKRVKFIKCEVFFMLFPTGPVVMTQGKPAKLLLSFALPLMLGNILQQLYSTVDTLVVGRYCGAESLAAVGTSSQPIAAKISA